MPLGSLLVDLGYVDEAALADSTASLCGVGTWDGHGHDTALATKLNAELRAKGSLPLRIMRGVLHYATLDPRDTTIADALCLATGARSAVPWVATETQLYEAAREDWSATELHATEGDDSSGLADTPRDACHYMPPSEHEVDGPIERFTNAILLDTLRCPRGRARITMGPKPALELGPRLDHPLTLERRASVNATLGKTIGRLCLMAGANEVPPLFRGTIRLRLGSLERNTSVLCAKTPGGRVALIERSVSDFAAPPDDPRWDDVRDATSEVYSVRGRRPLEAALRRWLAAAEHIGAPAELDVLEACEALALHLAEDGRRDEAAALVSRAEALARRIAPRVLLRLREARARSLGFAARSVALEEAADAFASTSLVDACSGYAAALGHIDPLDHPTDAMRVADKFLQVERTWLGTISLGAMDAMASLAVAHAVRGDVNAAVASLAELERLSETDPGVVEWATGLVRLAQGQKGESERLIRAAIGRFARAGHEDARWAATLSLARVFEETARAPEAAELCRAALASGTLDAARRDEAVTLAERVAKGRSPYR